jgi:hypothetical protein
MNPAKPTTTPPQAPTLSHWRARENGETLGERGSENGLITLDEEHDAGARITIERDGNSAPWSITCGIFGWMVHTRFFATEAEAQSECEKMKAEIAAILEALSSSDCDIEQGVQLVCQFVADNP